MTARNVLLVAVAFFGGTSLLLLTERERVAREKVALDSARLGLDSAATDARLQAEVDRVRVQLEQARVRSTPKTEPHLAISLTDGMLTLERGDIMLRSASIVAAVPRGAHSVLRVSAKGILLSQDIRIAPRPADADTSAVPKGTIWLSREDFLAVLPNVKPGHTAFLY